MEQKDLIRKFFQVCGVLQRQHFDTHHNHGRHGGFANPHRGQGRVLAILKLKPKTTQKELLYLLDMRPQSLGELLGKLEKAGLIIRQPSEKDKRVMEVELTEEGREKAKQADKISQESDDVLDCLTEEEQKNLNSYLDKILERLDKERGGSDPREAFFGRMRPGHPGQQRQPRPPRQPRQPGHPGRPDEGVEGWF